tara:strand:+ start:642 stop:935 length:294 start_codon:yes stop_codon:yes gene_type:complete
MSINQDDIMHIANLARIGLSKEDISNLQVEMANILEHFEVLKNIEVNKKEPLIQSDEIQSVTREDLNNNTLSNMNSSMLSNAPELQEGFIKIQSVFE